METDLSQCTQVLKQGGIILYPTDTVWGIGCDATNDEAIKKIYALKQRTESKSMIILLPDENQLIHYTESHLHAMREYLNNTDYPTTVIYPKAKNISSTLIGKDGSIAIRVCKEVFCMRLMEMFGKPLVSTSANRSGQTTPLNFQEIDKEIIKGVDHVVRYRSEESTPGKPSRIIALQDDGSFKIIRN